MRFGMDFGGTNIKAGIFNEEGQPINFFERKLSTFTQSGNLLDNLISFAREVIGKHKVNSGGLAIKGLINTDTGVLENDIGAGQMLAGINLKKAFSEKLGFAFSVENDARAYALGEYKFGAGKGSKTMVCMTLGTGYGCAVIADGKPYCGSDSSGGLLGGHISIDRNGPECSCGNRGCLELFCSATALISIVKNNHPSLAESDNILPDFFENVRMFNSEYLKTFNEFIENLAIGIVNAIHAYGPDTVVLGGGVMNSADVILPSLINIVHRRAWTIPKNKVKITKSILGNNAAAVGVAFMEK